MPEGLRTDQLGGIYVKPDERKKGIGTFMVGNLVTMLRNGNRDVCLYVRLDNGAARRIYGKLGFVDAGSYAALHF
jgi:predicted GNAT family acetyltransferase